MPLDMPPRLYLSTKINGFDMIDTPVSVSNVLFISVMNFSSVSMSGLARKCDLNSSHKKASAHRVALAGGFYTAVGVESSRWARVPAGY